MRTLYGKDDGVRQWLLLEWGPRRWFPDRPDDLHVSWMDYGRPVSSQMVDGSGKEEINTW